MSTKMEMECVSVWKKHSGHSSFLHSLFLKTQLYNKNHVNSPTALVLVFVKQTNTAIVKNTAEMMFITQDSGGPKKFTDQREE